MTPEELQKLDKLRQDFDQHQHNGFGSIRIKGENLLKSPQDALTAVDNGALSSGGLNSLKDTDSQIIANMRTRINELETALRNIGLLR
jgi:hypothetical protein